ncbi:MAG: hypothetical protein K0S46_1111 [Moraxellaceae bacterium]|jgi:hypothetical protein|nr:hypothetical protein [Moraxellaceae bacterium]
MHDTADVPPRLLLGMLALTVVALALLVLGGYALYRAWLLGRLVHLVQAVMPLFLGGWFLQRCLRFWLALARHRHPAQTHDN